MLLNTASLRPPVFTGIAGYTPLPCPMSQEEIAALSNDVLVAEIRHYLTVVEQKRVWSEKRKQTLNLMKGSNSANHKSKRPKG